MIGVGIRLLLFLILVGFVIYAAVRLLHYFSEDTVTGTGIQKLSFLLLVGLVVYAAVTGAS